MAFFYADHGEIVTCPGVNSPFLIDNKPVHVNMHLCRGLNTGVRYNPTIRFLSYILLHF
jgi:hypothetical protein